MSAYLDRLKQLEEPNIAIRPEPEPSKPPKAHFGPFAGLYQTHIEKKIDDDWSDGVAAVVKAFRKCSQCGRQGWHPQASAEICCNQAMQVIEHPAMSPAEYADFIHAPNTCRKIGLEAVKSIMRKDGITPKGNK